MGAPYSVTFVLQSKFPVAPRYGNVYSEFLHGAP